MAEVAKTWHWAAEVEDQAVSGIAIKKISDRYVICIRSGGAEDLQVRKVYRVLPDGAASLRGHVRVVDESGEDYLYPAEWFVTVELPDEAERALAATPAAPTPPAR